jgi:hypothetical protein
MSIEVALQAFKEKLEALERILSLFAASLGRPTIRKSDDGRGFRYAAELTSMRVQPKRMGIKARIISLVLSAALGSCANTNNPPTGFTNPGFNTNRSVQWNEQTCMQAFQATNPPPDLVPDAYVESCMREAKGRGQREGRSPRGDSKPAQRAIAPTAATPGSFPPSVGPARIAFGGAQPADAGLFPGCGSKLDFFAGLAFEKGHRARFRDPGDHREIDHRSPALGTEWWAW